MNTHSSTIWASFQLLSAPAQAWPFAFSVATSQARHSGFLCLHWFCLTLPHYIVCSEGFQSYSLSLGSSANFIPSSSSCLLEQAPITWSSHLVFLCLHVHYCHISNPLVPQLHPLRSLGFSFHNWSLALFPPTWPRPLTSWSFSSSAQRLSPSHLHAIARMEDCIHTYPNSTFPSFLKGQEIPSALIYLTCSRLWSCKSLDSY